MVESRQQRKWLAVVLAAAAGMGPAGSAYALEFGPVQLSSHLGEPLKARIPLTSLTADERHSLAVHIASPAMFKRFDIKHVDSVDRLRVDTRAAAGKHRVFVDIRTRRPVREPFLDFLVEADTNNGRALREYTVLLDPAPSAGLAANRGPAASSGRETAAPATLNSPDRSYRTAGTTPAHHASHFGPVRTGQTLWSIAARLAPGRVSIPQMLVAIYRANPDSFSGSIDRLRQGAVLRIPDAATAASIDRARARGLIRAAGGGPASHAQPAKNAVASGATPPATAAPPVQARATPPPAQASGTAPAAGGAGPLFPAPGTSTFGRLSMPDADSLSAASTVPATAHMPAIVASQNAAPQISEPAGTATSSSPKHTDVVADGPSAQARATVLKSSPAGGFAAPDAPASPAIGHVPDVASVGDTGLLSPRNLLLLVALAGLGVLAAAWLRRRQYKSMQLTDAEELETVAAAADSGGRPISAAPVSETLTTPPEAGVNVAAIQAADADLGLGEFSQARARLEAALEHEPWETALQDKLLEVDYLAGDAMRFGADVERFREDLQANGQRRANIAAMGRVLLPGDRRFETGATPRSPAHVEQASERPAPAAHADTVPTKPAVAGDAAPGAPPSQVGVVSEDTGIPVAADARSAPDAERASADSSGVETPDLDIAGSEPDDHQWQTRRVEPGADETIAFELDSDQSIDRPRQSIEMDADQPASIDIDTPEMIDPGDFDLEAGGGEQTPLDTDTVDLRLDLARMYLDMEDEQMARGLLEEVIENGNNSQRDTARSLLKNVA